MKIIKILTLTLCLCLPTFSIHKQSSKQELSEAQILEIKRYQSWTLVAPEPQLSPSPSEFG